MSRNPQHPSASVALINDAVRALQGGRIAQAEKLARKFVKSNPTHPDGLHLLGLIVFQQGKVKQSADLISKAVAAGSSNPAHFANLGLALKTLGRFEQALSAYDKAVSLDMNVAGAWNDRGNTLLELGRMGDAEGSYRRALSIAPRDAKAHVNLGVVLLRQGRADDAVEAYKQAIKLVPNLAAAHSGLGNALNEGGQVEAAIEAYEAAIAADGAYAEAYGNLAGLYENNNRTSDARATVERAFATTSIAPSDPHLVLILAKCDRRDDKPRDGADRLKAISSGKLPAALRRDIAFELSRSLDRLDDAPGAFAAMAEGNAQALTADGVDETLGDSFLDTLQRLREWFTPQRIATLPQFTSDDGNPDPVFLVGFPRSGTTLLGQVLDSHSGLVMVEERPMLDQVVARLRTEHGGYPEGLAELSTDDIAALRKLYFDSVDAECERAPGQRVVDKFPLHLVHVGLIRTIFPDARFLFAMRHPCDVVLSCFMQSFRPNPAMANFFTTQRGARTYDLVMQLWQHYQTVFDLPVRTVRYEDVVADFDSAVSDVLKFLQLDWQDAVRDYAERARSRGRIDTPSYHQVTEAIYTRARYRWRRYENELAPIQPTLVPWIEEFGYDSES